MKHAVPISLITFLAATFLGAAMSFAQCDGTLHMVRAANLAQSMVHLRSSSALMGQAQQLQNELSQLDEDLVEARLAGQFSFAAEGWIANTLTQLDAAAAAGAAGDFDEVARLVQQRRVSVGLSRFLIGARNFDCANPPTPQRPATGVVTTPSWPVADRVGGHYSISALTIHDGGGRDGTTARERDTRDTPTMSTGVLSTIALLLIISLFAARWYGKLRKRRKKQRIPCDHETLVRPRETARKRWKLGSTDRSGQGRPTRISDVNESGFALAQTNPRIRGSLVEVQIGEEWIIGQVRWKSETGFGVKVTTPLTSEQIALIVGEDPDAVGNNALQKIADIVLPA